MAVDTRDERASVLGFTTPFGFPLPNPDGSVEQADRQHVSFSYPGILAEAAVDAGIWTATTPASTTWGAESKASSTWTPRSTASTTWTGC